VSANDAETIRRFVIPVEVDYCFAAYAELGPGDIDDQPPVADDLEGLRDLHATTGQALEVLQALGSGRVRVDRWLIDVVRRAHEHWTEARRYYDESTVRLGRPPDAPWERAECDEITAAIAAILARLQAAGAVRVS